MQKFNRRILLAAVFLTIAAGLAPESFCNPDVLLRSQPAWDDAKGKKRRFVGIRPTPSA